MIAWEGMLCPLQRSTLVADSPASTTAAVTEQSLPSCCVYGAPYDFSALYQIYLVLPVTEAEPSR